MEKSLKYYLSKRSLDNLIGVHPDLVQVIERAIEITPLDFGVSEGLRTYKDQEEYVKSGKSKTLDSLHLKQEDGYSHAVDLYVYLNGKMTWEHQYFRKVIQAVFTAAIELGVQIEAGALWRDFSKDGPDSPHIQLNQRYYE